MAKNLILVLLLIVSSANQASTLTKEYFNNLLSAPDRPAEDSLRDGARKPADVLTFSGIKPGDRVLEIFAGAGWYTELLSRSVGPEGTVLAQNDQVIWQFAEQGINARTANNRLPNVTRYDNIAIVDTPLVANSLDMVFTALNYHDFFFTSYINNGEKVAVRDAPVDYQAVLAHIRQAMKPDGVFIIVDHRGNKDADLETINRTHRIDPDMVVQQMVQAGFKLIAQADFLSNPQDDLDKNVFDQAVRGQTDRFVLKFTKQK